MLIYNSICSSSISIPVLLYYLFLCVLENRSIFFFYSFTTRSDCILNSNFFFLFFDSLNDHKICVKNLIHHMIVCFLVYLNVIFFLLRCHLGNEFIVYLAKWYRFTSHKHRWIIIIFGLRIDHINISYSKKKERREK